MKQTAKTLEELDTEYRQRKAEIRADEGLSWEKKRVEHSAARGRILPPASPTRGGGGLIGVVRYSGSCRVCEHPDAPKVTAALLAHVGARTLLAEYPELCRRDIRQHERECLPRGTGRADEANNQRNQRRTA